MWSYSSFNYICSTAILLLHLLSFIGDKHNSFNLSSWVIFYWAFIILGALLWIFKIVLHSLVFFWSVLPQTCNTVPTRPSWCQAEQNNCLPYLTKDVSNNICEDYIRLFCKTATVLIDSLLSTRILSCFCKCSQAIPHFVTTPKVLSTFLYWISSGGVPQIYLNKLEVLQYIFNSLVTISFYKASIKSVKTLKPHFSIK